MTNTVETNEELIAKAREFCEREIKEWQRTVTFLGGSKDNHAENQLNSWTTHLAEMEEHKLREATWDCCDNSDSCTYCAFSYKYPCNFLVTKVKRLLGVE